MDVIMPKMGESVSEGTVIKWHKKKGDQVKRDEIIFEISTDKVDTEIPSPADGVLSEIKVQEGDTVSVGTVVAVIDSNGEEKPQPKQESKNEPEKVVEPVKEEKAEVKQETVNEEKVSKNENNASGEIVDIAMPKMGESVMEGTIIKWYKKNGDPIKKDETLFEISTDKVDTEVPSPIDGIVSEILVAEQETVEVGTVVARVSSGEAGIVSTKKEEPKKAEEQVPVQKPKEEPLAMHDNFSSPAVIEEKENKSAQAAERTSSKFYSPLVMNIAQKENVSYDELEKIEGTGLDGRVSKKDILNYIENRKTSKSPPVIEKEQPRKEFEKSVSQMSTVYSSDEVEKVEMDNIRQKIMQHMVRSRDISVHVSAMLEVDMTKIYNFLKKNKEAYLKKEGIKLTYMAFIANAAVKALREFPLVNSSIENSTIIKKKFINLGIAVAIEPTGLIVPNIKNAGEKNISGLAKSINDIAHRARNKRLSPDDISGGTFTITNYGVFGTIFGTPIINQPEVAILGVGAITKKPVVVELDGSDTIAIKPIMALTLSHDHRLVDGMLGGKFLMFIKGVLENFDESSL